MMINGYPDISVPSKLYVQNKAHHPYFRFEHSLRTGRQEIASWLAEGFKQK